MCACVQCAFAHVCVKVCVRACVLPDHLQRNQSSGIYNTMLSLFKLCQNCQNEDESKLYFLLLFLVLFLFFSLNILVENHRIVILLDLYIH